MDPEKIHRQDYDIGCTVDWIGTFDLWMRSEVDRGTITQAEHDDIIALNTAWKKDMNPKTNGDVKAKLTKKLARICAKKH